MKGHKGAVLWITCLTTGKRGYPDRETAKLAIRQAEGLRDRRELHPFTCEHCGRWHLGHRLGLTRSEHRRDADPTWVSITEAARQLQPRNLDRMRAVLQRAADEGRVQAIAAPGVTLIHRDEIPRLRLAAHDTRQDSRLKEL